MGKSAIGVLSLMGVILSTVLAFDRNTHHLLNVDPLNGEYLDPENQPSQQPPQVNSHGYLPNYPPGSFSPDPSNYPNFGVPADFPSFANFDRSLSQEWFYPDQRRGLQVAEPDYRQRNYYPGESSNYQPNYQYGGFVYDNANHARPSASARSTGASSSVQPFEFERPQPLVRSEAAPAQLHSEQLGPSRSSYERHSSIGQEGYSSDGYNADCDGNRHERQSSIGSGTDGSVFHGECADFEEIGYERQSSHASSSEVSPFEGECADIEGNRNRYERQSSHASSSEVSPFEGECADIDQEDFQRLGFGEHDEDDPLLEGGDCQFSMTDLPSNHGLLIESNPCGNILYPNKEGVFYVKNGDKFDVNCGVGTLVNMNTADPLKFATVQCQKGNLVWLNENEPIVVTTQKFKCSTMPEPMVVVPSKKTKNLCRPHNHYQVGYIAKLFNGFKLSYDVCVDNTSLYSGLPNITFVKKRIFNLKAREDLKDTVRMQSHLDIRITRNPDILDGLYGNVKLNLESQLAGTPDFQEVQNHPDQYYLIPSFLLNKLYFPYASEQLGHLLYINVKPMWTHLKNNWDLVEQYIHELAAKRDTPFDLYAGTRDYLQYRNQRLETKYLSLGPTGYPVGPVPKIFYNLLHDPDTNACVAIIGHNTPSPVGDADRICPIEKDVTSKITWLKQLGGPEFGVVYPCPCKSFVVHDPERPYESGLVQVGSMTIAGGDPLIVGGLLQE